MNPHSKLVRLRVSDERLSNIVSTEVPALQREVERLRSQQDGRIARFAPLVAFAADLLFHLALQEMHLRNAEEAYEPSVPDYAGLDIAGG